MKKRLLIASLAVVGIVGLSGGIVLANRSTPPVKPVSNTVTKAGDSTPAVTQQTTTPVIQEKAATPADTPVVTPPTPDENKTAIMKKITDYAVSRGWSDSVTYIQTTCFDRTISGSIGYDDYDALFDPSKIAIVNQYLAGTFVFEGSCSPRYLN